MIFENGCQIHIEAETALEARDTACATVRQVTGLPKYHIVPVVNIVDLAEVGAREKWLH